MNTPQTQGPGFLAALFPLTRYDDSLEVQISADDGRLHVTVRTLNHKPLEATGSPAELEQALPEAVTKYARWIELQEASRANGGPKITLPGEDAPARPKHVQQSAPRRASRAKTPKRRVREASFMKPMYPDLVLAAIVGSQPLTRTEVTKKVWAYIKRNKLQDRKNPRQINADAKLRPVFNGWTEVSMFRMTKLIGKHLMAKPASAAGATAKKPQRKPKASAPKTTGGKPGKVECIADYKALKAKHGDKLTRRLFVDNAKTGRRYESLWANSWPTFVREAEGGKAAATPAPKAPPAAKFAKPAKPSKPAPAARKATATKVDKGPWAVKHKGSKVGATIFEKKPGDKVNLGGVEYVAETVNADKREIHVRLASEKAPATTTKPEEAAAPKAAQTGTPATPPAAKPGAPYAIKTADGKMHGATVNALKMAGEVMDLGGRKFEVTAVDHNKREYTVKERDASAAKGGEQASGSAQAWPFATGNTPPKETA